MKSFKVGYEYNVFNEECYSSWNNTVKCENRTEKFVTLVEYDSNDAKINSYRRKIRNTSVTEYVYITKDSIVWAD